MPFAMKGLRVACPSIDIESMKGSPMIVLPHGRTVIQPAPRTRPKRAPNASAQTLGPALGCSGVTTQVHHTANEIPR